MKIYARAGLAALGIGAFAATGLADVVLYQNDFEEAKVGLGWSSNSHVTNDSAFSYFNGRYSGGSSTLTLTLPAPPAGLVNQYTLSFDLYVIDSWDGDDPIHGPDRFVITGNGSSLFDQTFANQHTYQSFRQPDVGPTALGFNSAFNDSIYRNIQIPFTGAGSIALTFADTLTQGMADESWGVDNVKVTYRTVPAPTALALFGIATPLVARRRR